jgi:GT2 family glycosyltransferase
MEPYVHSFMVHDELFCTGNFGLRRSLFLRLGGFNRSISYIGEDHDFAERCKSLGVVPRYAPDAVILHPPRLKHVRFFPQLDRRHYSTLREFYRANEGRRGWLAGENRRLLKRGLLMLTGALAPGGLAVMVGKALRKRRAVNQKLRAAGESFSVPVGDAVRHGLQMPVHDLAVYAYRRRYDIGGLTKEALDAALGSPGPRD